MEYDDEYPYMENKMTTEKSVERSDGVKREDFTYIELNDVEVWREYEFGPQNDRVTYRIESPVSIMFRKGGSTHRVLDSNQITHIVPAPGFNGCVIRVNGKIGA